MLLAIGDGGNPPLELNGKLIRWQAQNRRSQLGKIVRLNDDGSIPKDNPLANADANPAIWSYGHRNIQGLTYDPVNKRAWSTEHGSRGGDELNLVQAGENYGWPIVTHSREYTGGEISKERSRPGLVDPKLVWQQTVAPSGLAFYNGGKFPQWQGNLFAGGLVSQDVRRIQLDAKGNVVSQQAIEIGQRVRDVRQSPDGVLYVLTDETQGQLIRLAPTGS
jgi:glucose/arabinose dehydrogenase